MIKLFRTIRKKLIEQGKTTNYLKYAIGEIILVVIGILIALQINNWNNNRLEKLEEIKILISVKNDLENTISEFEFLNQVRNRILFASKTIFEMSPSKELDKKELDKKELDSLIAETFYRPTFNNTLGSIELLFSSGRINMIKNDSIREFLIAWPGYIYDMTEEDMYAVTLFQDAYYPVISKHVMISDLINQSLSTSFFGARVVNNCFPDISFESDYNSLLKDKSFFNHLRMRAAHMDITKIESEDLILKAQKTIRSIENDIKNQKDSRFRGK